MPVINGLILILFVVAGTLSCNAAEKRIYSSDSLTYVEWIWVENQMVLKSSVRGTLFYSKTGITLNNQLNIFKTTPLGKRISSCNDELMIVEFYEQNGLVRVQVALLNNAVAYRYVSDEGKGMRVHSEQSSFSLPVGSMVYYFERNNDWKLKSYAGTWETCPVESLPGISSQGPVQGLPLVLGLPDGKMAVATEVNLQNYSGLRWDCSESHSIKADFTEKDGFILDKPLLSPWRVIFVVDNLTELVNQQVVRKLSPAPDPQLFANTDYIVPGKAVWRWFSRGTGTPEEEREFVDFAHELGFRYSIIDEGYTRWEGDYWKQLRTLADYATNKKVKLILWNHSNTISDPSGDYLAMRTWLDKVQAAGMAGIKVDFMNSESKFFIDFEIRLLQESAKRQLVVNFHGCQQPAGEEYTYPNEVTREGIRGLELNKMKEGPIPSYHNVLLPFTRLVVGHGDYTPLSFVNPGNTTFAHQLATLVAFNSPLQVIAEDPEVLLNEPTVIPLLDLIKNVPTVWDETRVLPQTKLGKTAVVARRSGSDWYIYGMNGTSDEVDNIISIRELAINIKEYTATTYLDDLKAEKVKITAPLHRPTPLVQEEVVPIIKEKGKAKAEYTIRMAAHGGAVIWLTRNK